MKAHKTALVLCAWLSLCLASTAGAQQPTNQVCDVPFSVTLYDSSWRNADLVRGLSPQDFVVQLGGMKANVTSAPIDDGPKRFALVLDASRYVPPEEWALETEMADTLLHYARPGDLFALYLVGSAEPTNFVPALEMSRRVRELTASRSAVSGSDEKTYDTLLTAARSLDPPLFGDVLFLFGHPDDTGSKAGPDELRVLLLRNRIRFVAVSFTDLLNGKIPPGWNPNKPLPPDRIPKLTKVNPETGYYFSFHAVEALSLPGQMQLFRGLLKEWFTTLAEPYRLKIDSPVLAGQTKLEIRLPKLEAYGRRVHDPHYPTSVYPCSR
jgi:hypothetical protein